MGFRVGQRLRKHRLAFCVGSSGLGGLGRFAKVAGLASSCVGLLHHCAPWE